LKKRQQRSEGDKENEKVDLMLNPTFRRELGCISICCWQENEKERRTELALVVCGNALLIDD